MMIKGLDEQMKKITLVISGLLFAGYVVAEPIVSNTKTEQAAKAECAIHGSRGDI